MVANETSLLLTRHRVTVDEYYLMADAGVLARCPGGVDRRVEVWIIDLDAGRARFFRNLQGGDYADINSTDKPGTTALPGVMGVQIDLTGILR